MVPVDLVGLTIEAGSRAPVVLLREHESPRRVVPIFVGPNEAVAIALKLQGESLPRPLTHDLLAALVDTLGVHVDRVEVTELRDGTFFAELAVSGPTGVRRVDSRPSDAIALAVRVDAPLFVSADVLDEVGAVMGEVSGEEASAEEIEEEVGRFRSFLDSIGPGDFGTDAGGGSQRGPDPDDPPDPPDG